MSFSQTYELTRQFFYYLLLFAVAVECWGILLSWCEQSSSWGLFNYGWLVGGPHWWTSGSGWRASRVSLLQTLIDLPLLIFCSWFELCFFISNHFLIFFVIELFSFWDILYNILAFINILSYLPAITFVDFKEVMYRVQ